MRFPKMTTRGWMVAVAALAVILASTMQVVRLWRLSAWYAAEANQAAFWEMTARQRAQGAKWAEEMHRNNLRLAREELAKPMYQRPEYQQFGRGPILRLAEYHESEA